MVYEKELVYKVVGCAMEIYNELGHGFLEKVYENALIVLLKREEIKFKSQYPIKVKFRNEVVGSYIVDILIEDKVVIELKSIEKLEFKKMVY